MKTLRAELRDKSQAELAREIGISVQLMCDILAGRRGYSAKLLKYLGFKRVVSYERAR